MSATLFDVLLPQPAWPTCRFDRCDKPTEAVCVGGLPLCSEHYWTVKDGPSGPILRPRWLREEGS